jgi:hypothetical protein
MGLCDGIPPDGNINADVLIKQDLNKVKSIVNQEIKRSLRVSLQLDND